MKLHTRTVGTGSRTAALVPGATRTTAVWDAFVPYLLELEPDLKLILVDQRGHGLSPRADSYRIEDYTQDLVDTLPMDLDFLIGSSLGGLSAAWASAELRPKRYIGVDPALRLAAKHLRLIPFVSPIQKKLPPWALRAMGVRAALIPSLRAEWAQWDETSMRDIKSSVTTRPFPAAPPAVPSTIVLAGPSFAVPPAFADELRDLGWDVRVMPGVGHDLHVEDPAGLAAVLADLFVHA